jgi:hypothetical protein
MTQLLIEKAAQVAAAETEGARHEVQVLRNVTGFEQDVAIAAIPVLA